MKSVIEKIYNGERGCFENINESEKYWEISKEYGNIYDELAEGLTEKQKKILDNLFIVSGGLEAEAACTHFKEGFKLGLLIAIEVFY